MFKINKRYRGRLGLALAGVALVAAQLSFVASPASAAPTRNCVGDLTGRAALACFATLTEAMTAASDGRFRDAPASAAEAAADPSFAADVNAANAAGLAAVGSPTAAGAAGRASVASTLVISIEYDLRDHDGTGGSLIWQGDKECSNRTTDVDYDINSYNVSAPAWVDRISSFRTFANCWTTHHESVNFNGASVGFEGSRSYIGVAMDNRTSSQEWS